MSAQERMIETAAPRRLKSVIVISVLILIQVYRIYAYSVASAALTGGSPEPWFLPAVGDVFFGITAPFMAFFLWRKTGLGMWVLGIVWIALSAFDYVDGITTSIIAGPPNHIISNLFSIAFLAAWVVVDIIALVLLTRRSVRAYFLGGTDREAVPNVV